MNLNLWYWHWRPDGWHRNGDSWRCPRCGWSIGSNLRGERPFWWVYKHRKECAQ